MVIGLFLSFSIITLCNPRTVLAQDAAGKDVPPKAAQKTVMVFGDSLVAGYGLQPEQAFPARLQAALEKKGENVKVVNAGVSGDTTADGLNRLDWMLKTKPQYVILVLGGNDMLRHLDPKLTASNLDKIMRMLHNRHIPVLIAGMQAFTNMGYIFGDAYLQMYKELAKKYDAVYYAFFLDGVATEPMLNQEDGLHPNEAGVGIIVKKIMPTVEKLLARPPATYDAAAPEEAPTDTKQEEQKEKQEEETKDK